MTRELRLNCDFCQRDIAYSEHDCGESVACPNCQRPVFLKYQEFHVSQIMPRQGVAQAGQNRARQVRPEQVESEVRNLVMQNIVKDPSTIGMEIESFQLKTVSDRHYIATVKAAKVGNEFHFQMMVTHDENGLQVNWVKENNTKQNVAKMLLILSTIIIGGLLAWTIDGILAGRGDLGFAIVVAIFQVVLLVGSIKKLLT